MTPLHHPPDFVLVGVARTGTTSLHHYFSQHPDLTVAPMGEVNFLSWPGAAAAAERTPWLRFPVTDPEAYDALFRRPAGAVAVDLSASCFHSEVALDRIRTFVPNARLLVLLRDPVARAWSAYLNRRRKGYESRPPELALVPGERAVDNGTYAPGLRRLFDAVGRERVTVWLQDDLRRDTPATVASMFRDLGVRDDVPIETSTRNQATVPRFALLERVVPDFRWRRRASSRLPAGVTRAARRLWSQGQAPPPRIPADVEARLRDHYAADVAEVAALIDRDLTRWGPTPEHLEVPPRG